MSMSFGTSLIDLLYMRAANYLLQYDDIVLLYKSMCYFTSQKALHAAEEKFPRYKMLIRSATGPLVPAIYRPKGGV